MFCGKCGVENKDDARFCRACGAEINANKKADEAPSIGTGMTSQDTPPADMVQIASSSVPAGSGSKHKKVGIIAVAVIVIVVLVAGIALFGGGKGYEKVADEFVGAIVSMDASKIIDLVPDKVIDNAMEEFGLDSGDVDGLVELLEYELMGAIGYLEDYLDSNYEITHEVTGVTDASDDTIQSLQNTYSVYGVNVSDAKYVDVMITITSGEQTVTEPVTVPVMKADDGWYLEITNL